MISHIIILYPQTHPLTIQYKNKSTNCIVKAAFKRPKIASLRTVLSFINQYFCKKLK